MALQGGTGQHSLVMFVEEMHGDPSRKGIPRSIRAADGEVCGGKNRREGDYDGQQSCCAQRLAGVSLNNKYRIVEVSYSLR
jgi:hypothetical protein